MLGSRAKSNGIHTLRSTTTNFQDSDLSSDRGDSVGDVETDHACNRDKLDSIHEALTHFVLRDKGLGPPQTLRKLLLRQAGLLSRGNQVLAQHYVGPRLWLPSQR